MFEKISRDINNFDKNIQGEYKDYYNTFLTEYGYTPIQYMAVLFWELLDYFPPKNALLYRSIWRNVDAIYGKTGVASIAHDLIFDLSKCVEEYQEWAMESDNRQWDFQEFSAFPFIHDENRNYISISEHFLSELIAINFGAPGVQNIGLAIEEHFIEFPCKFELFSCK